MQAATTKAAGFSGAARRIHNPHPNDVLSGRGGGVNGHEGNIRFRVWVAQRKNDYILAPCKKKKDQVARDVIAIVQNQDPPGRFLQKDPMGSAGNAWIELDDGKMMARTRQALREGAPVIREAHKYELQEQRRTKSRTLKISVHPPTTTTALPFMPPVTTIRLPAPRPDKVCNSSSGVAHHNKRKREHNNAYNARRVAPRYEVKEKHETSNKVSIVDLITIDLSADDQAVVEEGLTKLGDFCIVGSKAEKEGFRREMQQAGGHACILRTLHWFRDSVQIQTKGLRALQNACCDYPKMKTSIVSTNGIEKVLEAMKRFPQEQEIQKYGCGVLDFFIRDGPKFAEELVKHPDGISTLIAAMKAFPQHAIIQIWTCHLFCTLCMYKWQNEVKAAGVGPLAALALSNHFEDKCVSVFAKSLINLLLP